MPDASSCPCYNNGDEFVFDGNDAYFCMEGWDTLVKANSILILSLAVQLILII
jgi:uncharacterized repeat protein (TIGR04076 family)